MFLVFEIWFLAVMNKQNLINKQTGKMGGNISSLTSNCQQRMPIN